MKNTQTTSGIVVGLDLGTTKVSAVVGEVDADEGITILGVGNVPCRGLRKGVVSNIDQTVRSIREAVDAAQTMAGVEIDTVYVGVAGSHIRSQISDGVCAISGREVTRADLERVLEGARAIPVDADRMICMPCARVRRRQSDGITIDRHERRAAAGRVNWSPPPLRFRTWFVASNARPLGRRHRARAARQRRRGLE